jgi:peptidyl-dipeptidase Dcp
MRTNPLLAEWGTPQQFPPFDQIAAEHFVPAFDALFAAHQAELDAIAANPAAPDFANTVEALAQSGLLLERTSLLLDNLSASVGSEALQAVERDMAPRLAAHHSSVYLNAALFARLDAVYRERAALGLDEEQQRLLARLHRNFVRAGARLAGAARSRFAAIESRLAELQTAFSQNVLADEGEYVLPLGEDDIDGLPGYVLDAARNAAAERGLAGYALTLSRSAVIGFLTYATRRDLREQLWRAWTSRGENPARANAPLAREILALRTEKAALLGYASYADYALEDRMAGKPQAVYDLLAQVWEPAKQRFAAEKTMLQQEAARQGLPQDIQPWDWWLLAEKVRVARYALDDAQIKPYFSLPRRPPCSTWPAACLACSSPRVTTCRATTPTCRCGKCAAARRLSGCLSATTTPARASAVARGCICSSSKAARATPVCCPSSSTTTTLPRRVAALPC